MSMALDIQQQGQVVFDQQGQLDKIIESLMPGEQVLAVYDAIGAGTIGSRPPVVRCRRSLLWTSKVR